MSIQRGKIYFVNLNPVHGREQAGMRPVLVLSIDTIINSLNCSARVARNRVFSEIFAVFHRLSKKPGFLEVVRNRVFSEIFGVFDRLSKNPVS